MHGDRSSGGSDVASRSTSDRRRDETLKLMLGDMEQAPSVYRPTRYWEILVPRVLRRLEAWGIDKPKLHPHFVPVYCSGPYRRHRRLYDFALNVLRVLLPEGGFLKTGLRDYLVGLPDARTDYAVFVAADRPDRPPFLQRVSESDLGGGRARLGFNFQFEGKSYSRGFLKYLKGLAFLKRAVDTSHMQGVIEIGGGIGLLGEIMLKAKGGDYSYVDIDIPLMAAIATQYLRNVFGPDQVLGYDESRNMAELDIEDLRRDYRAVVLCPWQLPRLRGEFDLFVNFSSFQEMEPHVVQNYICRVAPMVRSYALIENRTAGQIISTHPSERGVETPTTMADIVGYFEASGFHVGDRSAAVFPVKHSEIVALSR